MLTVPEAARRVRRDPETVRRWIRAGRLRARKIGTQHVIEEEDLADFEAPEYLPMPDSWKQMDSGRPIPDILAILRQVRSGR